MRNETLRAKHTFLKGWLTNRWTSLWPHI